MEILVVIGIVALLMALLLPALSSVRRAGRKTAEQNDLRSILAGWSSYASDFNERILPGYLETDVQQQWKVNFPREKGGGSIDRAFARSYPFRLLSYVSFHLPAFYGYAKSTGVDVETDAADIAEHPAFGYNGLYLGGWYEGLHPGGVARMRFELANVTALNMSQIQRTTETVVFTSSAAMNAGLRVDSIDVDTPGSHFVVPPFVGMTQQWQPLGHAIEVMATTSVPLPRYGSQLATGFADGHTALVQVSELNDQRKWIPAAESADFTHAP